MLEWWIWSVAGLVLLAIELVTPGGFYICFFGLGALAVSALSYLNIISSGSAQWFLFSIISIILVITLRKKLQRMAEPPQSRNDRDDLIGKIVDIKNLIEAGASSQIEYRGTVWNCKNIDASKIAAGTRAKIVNVDGLTLEIRSE